MPNGDPRDRFFYPTLILSIESYNISDFFSRTYVEDLLEGDRKFIIFAHHQEVLDGVETVVKDKVRASYLLL